MIFLFENANISPVELIRYQETVEDLKVSPEIVKLFYLSFRYSQGSPEQQSRIFMLVNKRVLPSELPAEIPEDIKRALPIPADHILIENASLVVFEAEWRKMRNVLCGSQTNERDKIKNEFLKEMVDIETIFIKRRLGRPGRVGVEVVEPDSSKDPYASFFRKYILLGKNTGNDFYNGLFTELREDLKNKSDILHTEELESLWESKHKGVKFYPEN